MTHWASKYIGIPYVDGGRGPDGYDCWGLVRAVLASEFGVELPSYEYGRSRLERSAVVEAAFEPYTKAESLDEGVVVLCHHANRRPHVGIGVDKNTMLHALRGVGACLVPLNSPAWKNGITGFYLPTRRPT